MEILVPMKNSLRIGALIGCFALLSGALSVPAYAQAVVSLQASRSPAIHSRNWTGNVAKSTTARATITMTAPETATANFAKK